MSGRKLVLKRFQTVKNGDMSATSITSAVTNIEHMDNIAIQLNASGTPVGAFTVQCSIDYDADPEGNVRNAGNWVALNFGSPISISGADNLLLDVNQVAAPWIRVVYTKSSGTGTLQAFISGKML